MQTHPLHIYTDGSSRGNPGPGGFGVVLIWGDKRKEISQGYKLTTNIAEADIKDKEGNKSTYPILNSSTNFKGVAFGIHFTYTLPAFPVDPFSGISAMSIEY